MEDRRGLGSNTREGRSERVSQCSLERSAQYPELTGEEDVGRQSEGR